MALVLVVEDGTGKSDANTYISQADADAYFEAHLYATGWTGATSAQKDAALAMATRLLDQQMLWNGWKSYPDTQALQWPRQEVADPDNVQQVYPTRGYGRQATLDSSTIYPFLKNAVCELALKLLQGDRTKDPDGEGIKEFALSGVLSVVFDQSTKKPVIPEVVWTELLKYGRVPGSGSAKLVRV